MNTAYVIDIARTGRGKRKGSLAGVHAVDLAAHALESLIARTRIDPLEVEDVVLGCVTPVGEQAFNIARGAVLAAGLPIELAGVAVNRFCGSGLQAVNQAAMQVMSGQAELAIGGGVEAMTRVPMGSDAVGPGEGPASPRLLARFPDLVPQGLSAELIAEKWQLTRDDVDGYAVESQRRAGIALTEGRFNRDIAPIEVTLPDGTKRAFATDEHARPNTTREALAALKPAFKEGGVIHAGNSSGIVDGAAAVLVASEAAVKRFGLTPRARIVQTAVAGSDPLLMLTGPIPSTRKAFARSGWSAADIDVAEINEAFAPVPIVVARELGLPMEKVNPNGGAIALGHPLGATGAILLGAALAELERTGGRRGLVSLCIGYGMGISTLIERV